jgi:hypothetical protein
VIRCALLLLAVALPHYELRGRLVPATRASVWLHGATSPFEDSVLSDSGGRFRFRDLAPGTYTLFAQAEDSFGVFGDPFAITATVI